MKQLTVNAVKEGALDVARHLLTQFDLVRAFSEELCRPLVAEDYVVQSMPDVSPTKWHLAHTTWFFETFILAPHSPGYRPFNPHFGYLFNSYYVTVGDRHCRQNRGQLSRPTVEQVYDYRRHVDEQMGKFLREASSSQILALRPTIEVGINHEQQHQELMLTDIKHVFWVNPLRPEYRPAASTPSHSPPPMKWISFDGGVYEIGHNGDGFAFDNESPRHRIFLEPSELASRPITNGEYLAFINEGGYRTPTLWLSEGWATAQQEQWQAPQYWIRQDDRWMYHTLSGLREIDPHEPACHVSYFEADAFARWAGAALPSEQQWEVASDQIPVDGNFAERRAFHPQPCATAAAALNQMFGDVWEWTRSAYSGYPGYRPAPGALGEYNGKFMCNQYVLRGGSCATPQSHIRRTYRNFFAPHVRWQFMGIRLAREAS